MTTFRSRQKLGKYRIARKLWVGQFATVYAAADTIEGVPVALKIPHGQFMTDDFLEDFRREVRLTAKLDHAMILGVKNADFIDGHFVIAYQLGEQTLADRIRHRMSFLKALDLIEQMLQAVAHAHRHRVIHCDIKPENFILFRDDRLRLTDFGISKVAARTVNASGSGTVGYVAPEQAMGRPSFRSDVFSIGLIMYRMLAGRLPAWPFDWPPPGHQRLRGKVHPDVINLTRRAIMLKPSKRFRDAEHMLSLFLEAKPKVLRYAAAKRRARVTVRRRRKA